MKDTTAYTPSIIPERIRTAPGPQPRTQPDRGQSATIGVVLILAIVLFGSLAIVATGGAALKDGKQDAELSRAEHALAQFDAKASLVALGESPSQSVPLGATGSGQFDFDGDEGWITVVHHDYRPGVNETILERPLGTLVYRVGDASVAYQGGGVWRADGPNESSMVSPPEFHYRAETLVLPVVSLIGSDSAAGNPRALVTTNSLTERIYPANGSATNGAGAPYDNGAMYRNPVRGGSVTVTVESEYYQAWGRYFETRTQGRATYDHANQRAVIELTAPRFVGAFQMPDEGNHVPIRGLVEGHRIDRFNITLAPDDTDAAEFNNLQWSMYAKDGSQSFEVHLRQAGTDNDPTTNCKEQHVAATVYYSETNGNTYHGWHNDTAFRTRCTDRNGDGTVGEIELVANFTSGPRLAMQDLSSDDLLWASASGSTRVGTVTFDEHESSVAWEPTTFTGSEEAPTDDLLNHYFGLLGPEFDLVIDDKDSDSVNERASTGILEYDARGRVTYIHISANEVMVELS